MLIDTLTEEIKLVLMGKNAFENRDKSQLTAASSSSAKSGFQRMELN